MNEPTMETLARRLDRVERWNRCFAFAMGVGMVVVLGVVCVSWAQTQEDWLVADIMTTYQRFSASTHKIGQLCEKAQRDRQRVLRADYWCPLAARLKQEAIRMSEELDYASKFLL